MSLDSIPFASTYVLIFDERYKAMSAALSIPKVPKDSKTAASFQIIAE